MNEFADWTWKHISECEEDQKGSSQLQMEEDSYTVNAYPGTGC